MQLLVKLAKPTNGPHPPTYRPRPPLSMSQPLEQVGVIGCGLVEAVVHIVPETTAELETLEDGEETRGWEKEEIKMELYTS